MFRYTSILLFIMGFGIALNAQKKPYFQQEVNYTIHVTLNDKEHTLSGDISFDYLNNSPDVLPEIWVHLWPNAFKHRHTAFCKQKLRDGNTRLYFAQDRDLGYFKNLDFSANSQKASWKYDPQNPDIARITLPQPLQPGARVQISTPFFLKIPASFSRLGHVGTSYQMTQWFPKPAVYDHKGWHAMPYLDIGEFYSEFGSFDVSITLPTNYVVGATGMLQNPEEFAFLAKKESETKAFLAQEFTPNDLKNAKNRDTFPPSATTMKTLRYKAENVHDFAWFADKRFMVLHEMANLESGKKVDCWAMFTHSQAHLWAKGAFYVRRAVEFYSRHVGDYPWPHATAVHSALSAGGGMEYPMITVIGNSSGPADLDDVITHEVGHNWFYGILASNERDHPWMDEGMNSYYEDRYMRQYYQDYNPFDLPRFIYKPEQQGPTVPTGIMLLDRERSAKPDDHSNNFIPLAYGTHAYAKTALCMHWLENANGTEKFDRAMKAYFKQWGMRHPYPEDFVASMTQSGIDVKWFMQEMQSHDYADFQLKKVEQDKASGNWQLNIKNKGRIKAPFPVTALGAKGDTLRTVWYQEAGKVQFPAIEAKTFIIDNERVTLDFNRKNNMRRSSGLFPGVAPLRYVGLQVFQQSNRHSSMGLLPWIGWNNADKAQIGFVAFNPPLPSRRLQLYLAPAWSTAANAPTGLADLRYKLFPGGIFPKITIGLSAKSFHFDYNFKDDYYLRMYRFAPQVRAELRDKSVSFQHFLNFRTLFIGQEDDQRGTGGVFAGKTTKKYTIHELRYEARQKAKPNPYHFVLALESQNGQNAFDQSGAYLRTTATWDQQLLYAPGRAVSLRAFTGFFLQNDWRARGILPGDLSQGTLSLNPQGFNDYRFDQIFMARSGGSGILGRQVSRTEGGFKGAFGAAYGGQLGNSNNFVLALNLKADLPRRLPLGIPLKPWFDVGYFDDNTPLGKDRPTKEQLLWSGGLMLGFFGDALEIYFPLANSKTLKDLYCEAGGGNNPNALFCGGNYLQWISWSVKVPFREPGEVVDRFLR